MAAEYNLETLLELRRQEQEDAEDEYARELQELNRREEFVSTRRAELEEAVERRQAACAEHDARLGAGEATMAQMRLFDDFLAGLREDEARLADSIERAERSVEQQRRAVAGAKGELIEATKELKAVEKHKEAWEKQQETKEQRKEAAAMDDVAARRWMENNR